jgi:hypothetical protein
LAPGAGHERRKVEDQAVRLAHFLDYEFCHHRPGRCCSLVILFPTCDKCKTTPLGCTSLAAAQFSFSFYFKSAGRRPAVNGHIYKSWSSISTCIRRQAETSRKV